ncbi:MAG: isochorismatase [Cyanobacteria bacterium J06559_3]
MPTEPAIAIESPYQTRRIRFMQLTELNGWRVKVYGISARREFPDTAIVKAAEELAQQQLPLPAIWSAAPDTGPPVSEDRYGVAILIVHEGREGNFVLVSWWVGENMIQHHVYFAPTNPPFTFTYLSPTGLIACVWELAILAFERQAWIDTVLANPSGPDLDAYLTRQLATDI